MLDPAEEGIGGGELIGDEVLDAFGLGESPERVAGRGDAQLRQAAAPDELLGLREELDLADAAAAELDVVAGDGDAAAAAMRVDLALDRVDVLDRREIEMLAPQERPQLAQEGGSGGAVAGHRARLDEG